jgi:hypothetical protein
VSFFFLFLIFICLLTYSFEIRKSLNISCLRKSNGKKYSYKINGKDCLIKNLIWDFIKFWMTKLEFYFVKFSVSLSGLPSQEQGTRIYFLFFIFVSEKDNFEFCPLLNIMFFYLVASFPSYTLNPALPHSRSSSNYSKSQEAVSV